MGQAGKNFNKAIDLSRMAMKSAPVLGMHPQFMQQEMVQILTGNANQKDTLFRRLQSDTQTLSQFKRMGGDFNSLKPEKKVELLAKALAEFSKDTGVAEFNMRSLHNQLTLLQNAFTGFASILKPIGDLLLPVIQKALMGLNKYLETTARKSIENMASVVKPFFADPERTLAGLMTLKRLPENVHTEKKVLEVFGSLKLLEWGLELVGIKMNAFSKVLGTIEHTFFGGARTSGFFDSIKKMFTSEGVEMGTLASGFAGAVMEVFGAISKILFIFQIFTKGLSYAKIWDTEFIAEHMGLLTGIFAKFSAVMGWLGGGLANGVDYLARFVGWVFSFGVVTETVLKLIDSMLMLFQDLADLLLILFSPLLAFVGLIAAIFGTVAGGGGKEKLDIGKMFTEIHEDILSKGLMRMGPQGAKEIGKTVQNIGKIEMRLDFKENMQPDRVAFTIMDQLKKVGQNPTQPRGGTYGTSKLNGGGNN